jgi:hypothetical protein
LAHVWFVKPGHASARRAADSAPSHTREQRYRTTHRNALYRIAEQLVLLGNCVTGIGLTGGVAFHVTLLLLFWRNPDHRLPVCVPEKEMPAGTRLPPIRFCLNAPRTVRGGLLQADDASMWRREETRGPVATPAGHILLPTHREVMTAAFGLPLWVIAPEGLPRLPCVKLRVCIPRRREFEPKYYTDID